MTASQIRKAVKDMRNHISGAQKLFEDAKTELKHIQNACPHKHTKCWKDADGFDGEFTVEKCLDCGLQQDGGLHRYHDK